MHNHVLLLAHNSVHPVHFTATKQQIELAHYQLYAVQKWIQQRRPFPCLVVYTANPEHRVSLDALVPDNQAVWDSTVALLRADDAKQKQTPYGTLMVTSLAHFRSDYTIVQIPGGNFDHVKHQLYANISLLRMGCSGRTALTLEDPSDSTRERFISAYNLPDSSPASVDHLPLTQSSKPSPQVRSSLAVTPNQSYNLSSSSLPYAKSRERASFLTTILELVKLIQASLALFGMYPSNSTSVPQHLVLDGLLCDHTVEGIRAWTTHVGGPCVGLEPTERVADPLFVSAILTLVLSIRNKLAYLGYTFILPRDPFLYPYAFSLAISSYIQSTAPPPIAPPQHHRTFSTPHYTVDVSTPLIPAAPPLTNILSAAAAAAAAQSLPIGAILTRELVEAISAAYDTKLKAENRKVRRVIKNRLAAAPSAGIPNVDSDGAERESELRDQRRHTLSLSLSAGEGSAGGGGSGGAEAQGGQGSASVGSIGSSGGQILSGIGSSLASGLRLGTAGAAGAYGDPGALMAPTLDLAGFVTLAVGSGSGHGFASRREKKSRKSKERSRRGESVDIGAPYERDRDHVIAGTVRALWSGRVVDLVRMREEAEGASYNNNKVGVGHGDSRSVLGDRDKWKRDKGPAHPASDGEESWKDRRYDGRSTEEESDVFNSMPGSVHSFGGMWSGRVRGKLGTWAGLAKKKTQSVDLSRTPPLPSAPFKGKEKDMSPQIHANTPTPPRLIIGGSGSMSSRPSAMSRRSTVTASGPQSPTLPPMVFTGDGDDDDLLSSGQVSPLSDYRPSPFNMLGSNSHALASAEGLSTDLGFSAQDYERTLAKLLGQKRPWADRRVPQSARVASWADPMSASSRPDEDEDEDEDDVVDGGEEEDVEEGQEGDVVSMRSFEKRYRRSRSRDRDSEGEREGEGEGDAEESDVSRLGVGWKRKGKEKEKARFHSLLSVVDGAGVLVEEPLEESDYEGDEAYSVDEVDGEGVWKRKRAGFDPRRRRSFHDLDTFRGIEVLSPERMKIDVDICGHLLIIWRREEHLRNVITCARLITQTLSKTNLALREHYETHLSALSQISTDSAVLGAIESERSRSLKILQSTNTLEYESAQFLVDDLWQTASPSRRKVFAFREKVFGTGGRRLPAGMHGAHGAFNRLQWTLDGRTRVVDYLGRTESEAEEESKFDELPSVVQSGGAGMFIDAPATPVAERHPHDGDEEDVVEHPGIKPMWLLRFFTSWGARWSAATAATPSMSGALSPGQKEGSSEPEKTPVPEQEPSVNKLAQKSEPSLVPTDTSRAHPGEGEVKLPRPASH